MKYSSITILFYLGSMSIFFFLMQYLKLDRGSLECIIYFLILIIVFTLLRYKERKRQLEFLAATIIDNKIKDKTYTSIRKCFNVPADFKNNYHNNPAYPKLHEKIFNEEQGIQSLLLTYEQYKKI